MTLIAGEDEEQAKDDEHHLELVDESSDRQRWRSPRITKAPNIPQNNTRCWYLTGIAIEENRVDQTKTLSTLSAFSVR